MFQMLLSAFGNGLSALPPIIMYGDDLNDRAFESSVCVISSKLANFTLYPLEFFALTIAFYLWHALVKKRLDIEKRTLIYFSGAIWGFTIIYNIFEMARSSQKENWGVRTSLLNCKKTFSMQNVFGFLIPASILVFITIIMMCHSSIILYERWKNFNHNMNRTTAIKLGHAVRIYILCITIIILSLLYIIPRIFHSNSSLTTVSSFASASMQV
ncbi:17795_t:CDS:2 [Funneliformis caledonium]|uniref:17795_t:CDS:1 n=1 Tax=Funneliformis caledonium TaxID=1117310 RepID=A0A9N9FT45_9GLOM|nr:17795_t:CDS:2 [Funneliformis caledonium]